MFFDAGYAHSRGSLCVQDLEFCCANVKMCGACNGIAMKQTLTGTRETRSTTNGAVFARKRTGYIHVVHSKKTFLRN